jgi:hypothetical protein
VPLGTPHAPVSITSDGLKYFADGRWCNSAASLEFLINDAKYPVKRYIEPEEPVKKYLTDIKDLDKCEEVSVKYPDGETIELARHGRWGLHTYGMIDMAIRLGMPVKIIEECE